MIDQNRYVRMTYHMEQDINWLREKTFEQEKVLRQLYGDIVYKKIVQKIDLLSGNIQEMKQDLRVQRLL